MTDASLILFIFLSVDALVLLLLLILHIRRTLRQNRIRHYGDRAEEEVKQYLQTQFPNATLLHNVFLKTEHGVTQIDHILLCKWGVFVIETKSHNGRIDTEKREWVQIYKDKVIRFHSPVLQNETHRMALVRILKKNPAFRSLRVTGLVVFTSQKVSFSRRPEGVLRLSELAQVIKSGSKTGFSRHSAFTAKPGSHYLSSAKQKSLEKWIRKHCTRSRKLTKDHLRSVRTLDRNGYSI